MKVQAVEVTNLIASHGGKLIRSKKHQVYEFPDGRSFTVASTPSDWRAWLNQLSDLKNFLGIVKHETTIGERRKRKQPPKRPGNGVKFTPRAGVSGGFDLYCNQEDVFVPGSPTVAQSPLQRGTTAHVAVTMRRPQQHHEVAPVVRFSKEAIDHANYLMRTQGSHAMNVYLQGAKQMVLSTDEIAEGAHRLREKTPELTAQGSIETEWRKAEQKAATFREESNRCKAEAEKWDAVAKGLKVAFDLIGQPAGAASQNTGRGGPRSNKGAWVAKIRAVMSDGVARTASEIRTVLMVGMTTAEKGPVYPAVANMIKRGKHLQVTEGGSADNPKYMWKDADGDDE